MMTDRPAGGPRFHLLVEDFRLFAHLDSCKGTGEIYLIFPQPPQSEKDKGGREHRAVALVQHVHVGGKAG